MATLSGGVYSSYGGSDYIIDGTGALLVENAASIQNVFVKSWTANSVDAFLSLHDAICLTETITLVLALPEIFEYDF